MGRLIGLILTGFMLFGCSQSSYLISGNIDKSIALRQTGNLAEILQANNIKAEFILAIAADGTAFFVSEKSFAEIYITQEKGKFNSNTTNLPPVCNLNNIIEICVHNSNFPLENYSTPFSIRISEFELLGENSRNGHVVRKYKLKGSIL